MQRNKLIRIIAPIYALLIAGGFLVNPEIGICVVIVGGMLSGILYRVAGGGGADGGRNRNRNRNRDRSRR